MPGPQYWHLTLKQIGEPKSVPRHILIILSSNGTFNRSRDRRKTRSRCLGCCASSRLLFGVDGEAPRRINRKMSSYSCRKEENAKNETVEINPSPVRLMARSSREEFRSAFRPLMLFVAGIRILQTLREKKPHRKLVGIVLSAPTSRSGRVSNGSPHLLCCCRLKLLKRASGFGLCVAYIVLLNRTS